jgi:hypothetical protein
MATPGARFSVPSSLPSGEGLDACARYSTRYSDVFGPPTWWVLHTFARNYPSDPSPARQEGCRSFLAGLPAMLPCELCGEHFRRFAADYPAGDVCGRRDALERFLCDAHNAVREATGKPAVACDGGTLETLYGTLPVCTGAAPPP